MADADLDQAPTIGQIASGLATDFQDLVRGELALARAEMDAKLHGAMAAAVSLVGGALVAFAGLVVLLEGGAALLSRWLPVWAALVLVGLLIVIVGGIIARTSLGKLSLKTLSPQRSAENLQKDAQMMKERM